MASFSAYSLLLRGGEAEEVGASATGAASHGWQRTDYFKGQTLNKGSFSKVIWVQPRQPGTGASATGLPKAAKLYQRPDNRAKSMWAAEIAMLKALAGNRNIVQVVAVYYTEHALMEPAHCCIVCTHISSSGARLTWRM